MRARKMILIATILVSGNCDASEVLSKKVPLINSFLMQYKGERSLEENQKLANDKCFLKANEFIYNPKMQKEIKVTKGNGDVLKSQRKSTLKVPNYENALNALYTCVIETSNPIAAWEGSYIIKTLLGLNYENNMQKYKLFNQILYKDNSCDGYLNYGDIYLKGLNTKPDINKAEEIYKEGLKSCANGWYNMVLQMKLSTIKTKKGLRK